VSFRCLDAPPRHVGKKLVDAVMLPDCLAVLSDDLYFFATQARILDGHSKQPVFVVTIVGGEGVLMQYHHLHIIRACYGKGWQPLLNLSDEVGFPLHDLAVGHGCPFSSVGLPDEPLSSYFPLLFEFASKAIEIRKNH
jgi:hypothetical protein